MAIVKKLPHEVWCCSYTHFTDKNLRPREADQLAQLQR